MTSRRASGWQGEEWSQVTGQMAFVAAPCLRPTLSGSCFLEPTQVRLAREAELPGPGCLRSFPSAPSTSFRMARTAFAKVFKPWRNWGWARTHPRSEEKLKHIYLQCSKKLPQVQFSSPHSFPFGILVLSQKFWGFGLLISSEWKPAVQRDGPQCEDGLTVTAKLADWRTHCAEAEKP